MPRLIAAGDGAAITLDALTDALDSTAFDPHDEDSFAALGPLNYFDQVTDRSAHTRGRHVRRRRSRSGQLALHCGGRRRNGAI